MTETLVREPGRREQLEAFYLSKVRPLAEGEEVHELGNIVAPVSDGHLALGGKGRLAEGRDAHRTS